MPFISPESIKSFQDQIVDLLEFAPLLCKVEIALALGINPDSSPVDDRWDLLTQALDSLWNDVPAGSKYPLVGFANNKDKMQLTYDSTLFRQYFCTADIPALTAAGLITGYSILTIEEFKQLAEDEGFDVKDEKSDRRASPSPRRIKKDRQPTLFREALLQTLGQRKGE